MTKPVKEGVNPWLKFFPSDWRADPALRMCSLAARGLWIEILCVMHEAVPRGTLRVNGKPITDRQLAALAGTDQVDLLLQELEEAGVFSREDDGTIISRRMMRDAQKQEKDKANGRKGGNPRLNQRVNPQGNPSDNGEDKAQKPEARSQIPEEESPPNPQGETAEELFELVVKAFPASPHSRIPKAQSWFLQQSPATQREVVAASTAYAAWFWTAQRGKGRDGAEALSFAPGLHKWLTEGGWKSVAEIPTAPPVEPMERLDRVRDEDLWLACERVQGRPAPTSDNSWSFKKSTVEEARRLLLKGVAA